MASEVEICNRALQKLGAKRITSLSADTPNARACSVAYGPVRDSLYRDNVWKFTVKRVQLAASTDEPEFGPANKFPLPADYIRLAPSDPGTNPNDLDWEIEDGHILTDEDAPLDVRYCYRVTDTSKMDALFCELLATQIAFEICEEITQSNTKKEGLREDAKDIIRRAKRAQSIEGISAEPPEDTWISVRS